MNTKSYAIVVGLNSYGNGIEALKGAVNDAKDFYSWLTDHSSRGGQLPEDNIAKFIDGDSPQTSYTSIRTELNNKMGLEPLDNVEEGIRERLYIYFAGHGITVRHPNVDENELTVFLSLENDDNNPEYQIAALTIKHAVTHMRYYKEVVLIMDCCRNLKILTNLTHIWGNSKKRADNEEYEPPKVFVMYASKRDESAREFQDNNGDFRGYFTEAMVRNLKGAENNLGQITFSSITDALHNEFKDELTLNPQLIAPDTQSELIFSDSGESLSSSIEIMLNSFVGAEGNLIIINSKNERAIVELANAPSPFKMEKAIAGSYTLILEINDPDIPIEIKYHSFRLGVGEKYIHSYAEIPSGD